MFKYGFINEATKDSLQDTPLNLNYTPESHREGIATYFRAYLKEFLKDWVNQDNNKKADGKKYNIYRDGLRVYTSIDSRMQIIAETSVSQHMKALQAEFFVQNTKQRNPTAPFLELEEEDVERLLNLGMKRSERSVSYTHLTLPTKA